ncbi:MAG: methionine--tRNA ligase [Kiritimatiellaeota bacterium]|nr:methionine--tRNA ligase [Kiritimatiellota bacterium]
MDAPSRFYVTTPIYYVNDKPHIGHAYTTILADVLARYHRLLGVPTWFLTGTDEHGQKVQRAAEENGISPQEQCDRTVVRFLGLWEKLDITCDDFIRTTESRHIEVVQGILQDLYDRGEIYADDYQGWYCVPCERFFTEKDLVGDKCPECGRAVERLVERNYFFRMSRYQDWLVEHIRTHPDFIRPEHRRQETLGFLRQPLGDLCISRPKARLAWGIELPFDSDYVTYVWFDALINYISAVGYGKDPETFRRWWPASMQLIGKDILTTHTVYWPIMLRAVGLPMPDTVFAHGWWLVGKDKMSKSLGNVVNPMEMAERYGADAFRYFLMAEMTLGQDASFTEQAFVTRYNADLANDLGNLASRVLKMVFRHFDGKMPPKPPPKESDAPLREAALSAAREMEKVLRQMQLDRGMARVMAAVREGNRYFEKSAPWKLTAPENRAQLGGVLYNTAECLRIVSGLFYPVMPERMGLLRQALGIAEEPVGPRLELLQEWGGLGPGGACRPLKALFPRIDVRAKSVIATAASGKPGAKREPAGESKEQIDLETFGRMQLRTAVVLEAERVEGAKKLLKLRIDLGDEQRQLVAGVAEHYRPEELTGKTIVVVANLKPAVIRGVESQGMLLAAKAGKALRLLTVDGEVPPGADIS